MQTVSSEMTNEEQLIKDFPKYYKYSLEVLNEFGGPSIYFHVQCIKEQQLNFLSERHIELIYATLASWGMHRMGDPKTTKTKLHEYQVFRKSILDFKDELQNYLSVHFSKINETRYVSTIQKLKNIYSELKVSISDSTIVANSKALAHILPHLIPPIDRQYTVRFFTQDRNDFFYRNGKYRLVQLPNGIDAQFDLFVKICQKIKRLFDKTDKNIMEINPETFNTSYPKIMDNVIMAYVKKVPKPIK